MPRTRLRGHNIRLSEIFSVERILAARGFTVERSYGIEETLFDKVNPDETEVDAFFDSFNTTEKRSSWLNEQLQTGNDYQRSRKRYSDTLEWYIGELLVRKFQAFSSAFGVKARNTLRPTNDAMGDFDVLAVMGDMSLLYAECKSGGLKIEEIRRSVERGLVLATAATIIVHEVNQNIPALIQTENYPGMEHTCRHFEVGITNLQNSEVLMWHDTFFLNSSAGLENKIQTCLRLIAQRNNGFLQVFGADVDYLKSRGFSISQ